MIKIVWVVMKGQDILACYTTEERANERAENDDAKVVPVHLEV